MPHEMLYIELLVKYKLEISKVSSGDILAHLKEVNNHLKLGFQKNKRHIRGMCDHANDI
jgi:hypothetical protein